MIREGHRVGGPCLIYCNVQVVVFRVMTLYSDVVGYQRFGGPGCQVVTPCSDAGYQRSEGIRLHQNVGNLDHYTAS
jgi:hypothetical protein